MTTLFIGVVSHERSRFAVSQGPDGLAHRLVEPLRELGVDATVHVNTQDLLDVHAQPVDQQTVQAGLSAELSLDRAWAAFLHRTRQPRWWTTHLLQAGRRAARRVRPPDVSSVIRLLNIELSHLDLMRRALAADDDWLLLLEDDASSPDVEDCARGLAGLMQQAAPAYVNVTSSFPLSTLGVRHLVREVPGLAWAGTESRQVLESARPFTNTVCAILYRREFLAELVPALDDIPLEPVLPIDWKLNRALMDLWAAGRLGPGQCWSVEPAPIEQLSMRPMG